MIPDKRIECQRSVWGYWRIIASHSAFVNDRFQSLLRYNIEVWRRAGYTLHMDTNSDKESASCLLYLNNNSTSSLFSIESPAKVNRGIAACVYVDEWRNDFF